jgi:stearoyl-CoA 9-desaturase NADPH oxidoreductase
MAQTVPSFRTTVARPLRAVLRSPLAAALTAPHGVNRYLALLGPSWSVDEVRATVVEIRKETPTTTTLVLRPNLAWNGHLAGQFVEVGIEIDGVRHSRCYSISSSAHRADGLFTLSVKEKPDGLVSRAIARSLRVGQVLPLSPARGEFVLPAERPDRIVFLSGGSGITPVMSMLRTLLDEGYAGDVTFLHYARSQEEITYRDELTAIAATHANVRVIRVLDDGTGDLHGGFSEAHLLATAPTYPLAMTYMCGPEGLMARARSLYGERGLSDRLFEERFTAAPMLATSSDAEAGTVHFARSSLLKKGDGRSLLVQAEDAGLSPEFGCRRGICHGCTRRKVSGTVRDLRTGVTSDRADCDIQLCVTAPVGDVTLDL